MGVCVGCGLEVWIAKEAWGSGLRVWGLMSGLKAPRDSEG